MRPALLLNSPQMPKRVAPLTDRQVVNAKAKLRAYRLFGGGLYLEVSPSGSKLWWLKYRRQGGGAETRIGFGAYPAVSLAMARQRKEWCKSLLAQGIDPGRARQAAVRAARNEGVTTFEAVARDWRTTLLDQCNRKRHKTYSTVLRWTSFPLSVVDVVVSEGVVQVSRRDGRGAGGPRSAWPNSSPASRW